MRGEGGNTGLSDVVLSISFFHNVVLRNSEYICLLLFFLQDLSVDFCPEQISARSSSFKSSLKYDSSNSETPNVSLHKKMSYNFPRLSSPKEDLENEVLGGSCLQVPETKFESKNDNSESNEDTGKFFFIDIFNIKDGLFFQH